MTFYTYSVYIYFFNIYILILISNTSNEGVCCPIASSVINNYVLILLPSNEMHVTRFSYLQPLG